MLAKLAAQDMEAFGKCLGPEAKEKGLTEVRPLWQLHAKGEITAAGRPEPMG